MEFYLILDHKFNSKTRTGQRASVSAKKSLTRALPDVDEPTSPAAEVLSLPRPACGPKLTTEITCRYLGM